ncbi:MAG: hypothetical protein ACYCYL_01435 [Acidithiobacillus sp.]
MDMQNEFCRRPPEKQQWKTQKPQKQEMLAVSVVDGFLNPEGEH